MAVPFSELLTSRLSEALARTEFAADLPEGFSPKVDQTQNRQFGDYQSNAAMILAKALKRNPREVATMIAGAAAFATESWAASPLRQVLNFR